MTTTSPEDTPSPDSSHSYDYRVQTCSIYSQTFDWISSVAVTRFHINIIHAFSKNNSGKSQDYIPSCSCRHVLKHNLVRTYKFQLNYDCAIDLAKSYIIKYKVNTFQRCQVQSISIAWIWTLDYGHVCLVQSVGISWIWPLNHDHVHAITTLQSRLRTIKLHFGQTSSYSSETS